MCRLLLVTSLLPSLGATAAAERRWGRGPVVKPVELLPPIVNKPDRRLFVPKWPKKWRTPRQELMEEPSSCRGAQTAGAYGVSLLAAIAEIVSH